MNIFLLLTIAMLMIILMLRRHIPIGPCMLTSGIFIWLMKAPELPYLVQALRETLTMPRTYDILFALYFVMCLEIELRTSGALAGMVQALQRIFSSAKVTLAVMPAFLGLLPSLGGARFSAPIVEEASKNLPIEQDHKAAINFWFRHIFEFSSPIIPGMIMACNIAGVSYSESSCIWPGSPYWPSPQAGLFSSAPSKRTAAVLKQLPMTVRVCRIYGWRFRLSLSPLFS